MSLLRRFNQVSCAGLGLALACLLSAGCTRHYYRESADEEVYKILQQKRKATLGQ